MVRRENLSCKSQRVWSWVGSSLLRLHHRVEGTRVSPEPRQERTKCREVDTILTLGKGYPDRFGTSLRLGLEGFIDETFVYFVSS